MQDQELVGRKEIIPFGRVSVTYEDKDFEVFGEIEDNWISLDWCGFTVGIWLNDWETFKINIDQMVEEYKKKQV